jgi:DNA (cytosine-5)-methyltransferase 1
MGYPDWMTFHPTKWHGFRLVGNGVPAQLGRAIALSIKQQIYGY